MTLQGRSYLTESIHKALQTLDHGEDIASITGWHLKAWNILANGFEEIELEFDMIYIFYLSFGVAHPETKIKSW